MHLKAKHIYLLLITIFVIISVVLKILTSFSNQTSVFLYSLFFHLIVSAYICYSWFELFVLQEKQGSKLIKSKQKLNSDWR